ncbi:probable folate-biopterin transporter 4 isoform X2 [Spinacia oleracea]|uniref:Probable folate-biopterin transporter 4 isoform X2 n=1 Tax=Spinacia oleracea TaxID=3562 RepID=A0ABM3QHM5_SPIOL|nr:probable folate-biopterin transporter 4 isoform X2 [Spinacia oleracea]
MVGFRSFVWTAVSYHLKDELKLSPSASQFVSTVAFFPWSIKPLYGIISDCIPIRGRRRIPYLIISTVFSLVPWIILGLNASLRSSKLPLMIFLTVQNIGSAMADVVADAMIAEAVRSERASFAGDLQSICMMSSAMGGIFGSLLGGYALSYLHINAIFLLFAILPALQLVSCGLVKESPMNTKDFSEDLSLTSSHMSNEDGNAENVDHLSNGSSKTSISRRKKGKKNRKKAIISNKSRKEVKNKSLGLQWFFSLKLASHSLFDAFKQPIILRPMAWFFLALITFPNISTVMFYYQTEFLNLDASFLGNVRVVGWLGLMLGTSVYNKFLKRKKLQTTLMWAQIGISMLILIDVLLVSRANIAYGISDKMLVLCGSAVAYAIDQFKFMPFLILSGQLCPPGIEGTLFALFMSINNLGATVSSFVGAWLASNLNISSGSFDNLLIGVVIQFFSSFIPLAFLFLIPKEATGLSA